MDGPITHTSVEPLNWEGEELVEEARVTGSVVEFSFGPCDDCYIATSYPYRADYAVDDIRKIATLVCLHYFSTSVELTIHFSDGTFPLRFGTRLNICDPAIS
jgi:hypothetical protein